MPGIIDRGEVPVPSSLDLLLLVLYQLCLTFFLQFKGYDYMVSGAFLTFEFLNLLLNEAQTRRGTEGSKLRPQQQVNPFRFYFRNFFNRNTYQYIFFNCFKIFLFYTSYSPLLSPSIVAYSEIWCRYVIQRLKDQCFQSFEIFTVPFRIRLTKFECTRALFSAS